MSTMVQKRKAYIGTGGTGALLSAAYLAMAADLPLGQLDQPGAAVFPIIVGIILMFASLAAIREGWVMGSDEKIELPTGQNLARLVTLMALLLSYVLVLPLLGQVISSTIFCILTMRLLSDLTWLRLLIYSLLMSAVLNFVFLRLFNVPMPRGLLAFW